MSIYDLDTLNSSFAGISMTFVIIHITKDQISRVIKAIYDKLEYYGVFYLQFSAFLKEGLQPEPLDNHYEFYGVNYSSEELSTVLENNRFTILENTSLDRENSLPTGIIIARKK